MHYELETSLERICATQSCILSAALLRFDF